MSRLAYPSLFLALALSLTGAPPIVDAGPGPTGPIKCFPPWSRECGPGINRMVILSGFSAGPGDWTMDQFYPMSCGASLTHGYAIYLSSDVGPCTLDGSISCPQYCPTPSDLARYDSYALSACGGQDTTRGSSLQVIDPVVAIPVPGGADIQIPFAFDYTNTYAIYESDNPPGNPNTLISMNIYPEAGTTQEQHWGPFSLPYPVGIDTVSDTLTLQSESELQVFRVSLHLDAWSCTRHLGETESYYLTVVHCDGHKPWARFSTKPDGPAEIPHIENTECLFPEP